MILKHHHRFHYTALSTSFWPCHVSWFYYRQPLPVLGPWCFSASLCGWGSGSYRHTSSWFTPVTPSGPARPLPLPRRWPSPTAMKSPGSARSWVRSGEPNIQSNICFSLIRSLFLCGFLNKWKHPVHEGHVRLTFLSWNSKRITFHFVYTLWKHGDLIQILARLKKRWFCWLIEESLKLDKHIGCC